MSTRVLIVDDRALRRSPGGVLTADGFDVVGEAADSAAAIEAAAPCVGHRAARRPAAPSTGSRSRRT
jgi:AmiR/NasT family two-component response regulator